MSKCECRAFTPEGEIKTDDTAAHNRAVEAEELAHLATGPDRAFLYVRTPQDGGWAITTWLGTVLDSRPFIGESRAFPCFGPFPSKRRSVRAMISGRLYVGWYYESSGQYCRLRKGKGY